MPWRPQSPFQQQMPPPGVSVRGAPKIACMQAIFSPCEDVDLSVLMRGQRCKRWLADSCTRKAPMYGMQAPIQPTQVPPFQVMAPPQPTQAPPFQVMAPPQFMTPYPAAPPTNGATGAQTNGNAHPTADKKDGGESGPKTYAEVGYGDIFKQFVLLGWTAFGGPAAHIALFQVSVAVLCIRRVRCLSGGGERADPLTPQKIFLEDNLNWMSSSLFMELFALGKSSASAMRRAARRPGCVEETRGSTLTSWARTRPVPAGAHLDAGVVRHRASEEGRGRGSAFGHAVPVPGAADDVLHWVGCRGGRLGEPLLQR